MNYHFLSSEMLDDRMWSGTDNQCPTCARILDRSLINENATIKRSYDLNSTRDGYFVCNKKFVSFWECLGVKWITFKARRKMFDQFVMIINRDSADLIDFSDNWVRKRGDKCLSCGYEAYYPRFPIEIITELKNDDRVYLSRLDFGNSPISQPGIVINDVISQRIKNEKISGINLIPLATGRGLKL